MDAYQLLSENYDELFPASPAEMAFLKAALAGKKRVLDIACGSGQKTALLTGKNRTVLGVDASPAMIDLAVRDHAAPNVRYSVMDMLDLSGRLAGERFDGIVCLGNSLAHLSLPEQLSAVLGQVYGLLTESGVFVGQILNFDRILDRHIDTLPVIETDRVIFRRRYEWEKNDMFFRVELENKATGETASSRTAMRPIRKGELERAMAVAGFGRAKYFGSFKGEPCTEDSYHLVFQAEI